MKGEKFQRLHQIIKGKGPGPGTTEKDTEDISNACLQYAKCGQSRDVGWWFLGKMSAKGMGKGIDTELASPADMYWYRKGSTEGKGKECLHRLDEGKGFGAGKLACM